MPQNVTIIITMFERPWSLSELLASIDRLGLRCPIIIADDSQHSYKEQICTRHGRSIQKYLRLPYKSGTSMGRNALLNEVQTDYFLLCEDDFLFDERSNLTLMQNILAQNDVDIIGGMVYNRKFLLMHSFNEWLASLARLKVRTARDILLGYLYQKKLLRSLLGFYFYKETPWSFYGNLKVAGSTCLLTPLTNADYTPPYTVCDFVPNYFMAKTAVLRQKNVYWDDDLKYYGEHLDFFLRAQRQGIKVAFTREAGIIHQRVHNKAFNHLTDHRPLMLRKNNLTQIKTVR